MDDVTRIGVDLAKRVFHLHGAAEDGSVVFRKKLSRVQFEHFMKCHARCTIAMEACGSAHHLGRLIAGFGHAVRLVPPVYAKQKQYIKRHKNDAADAEAIAEAASRPTLLFVAVKSQTQQAQAMAYRSRDMLVRQRRQLINALRGHLTEFGVARPRASRRSKSWQQPSTLQKRNFPSLCDNWPTITST